MWFYLYTQLFNDDALLKSFCTFIHTDRLSVDCLIKSIDLGARKRSEKHTHSHRYVRSNWFRIKLLEAK